MQAMAPKYGRTQAAIRSALPSDGLPLPAFNRVRLGVAVVWRGRSRMAPSILEQRHLLESEMRDRKPQPKRSRQNRDDRSSDDLDRHPGRILDPRHGRPHRFGRHGRRHRRLRCDAPVHRRRKALRDPRRGRRMADLRRRRNSHAPSERLRRRISSEAGTSMRPANKSSGWQPIPTDLGPPRPDIEPRPIHSLARDCRLRRRPGGDDRAGSGQRPAPVCAGGGEAHDKPRCRRAHPL